MNLLSQSVNSNGCSFTYDGYVHFIDKNGVIIKLKADGSASVDVAKYADMNDFFGNSW